MPKKKAEKFSKKIIVLSISCLVLAGFIVFAQISAGPDKVWGKVLGYKNLVESDKNNSALGFDKKEDRAENREKVSGQVKGEKEERFKIAAEGDCPPGHEDYTPFYENGYEIRYCPGHEDDYDGAADKLGSWTEEMRDSYQGFFNPYDPKLICQMEEGCSEDLPPEEDFMFMHLSDKKFPDSGYDRFKFYIPKGAYYVNFQAFPPQYDQIGFAVRFRNPVEGSYDTTGDYDDIDWLPSAPHSPSEFETEDVLLQNEGGDILILGRNEFPELEEGGWMYVRVLKFEPSAYIHKVSHDLKMNIDTYTDWYSSADFNEDGNPGCDGSVSGGDGDSGEGDDGGTGVSEEFNLDDIIGESLPEGKFRGMGIKDPYRGNGLNISSYLDNEESLLMNADYHNLMRTYPPGKTGDDGYTHVFEKSVESTGDVFVGSAGGENAEPMDSLIFQGKRLIWTPPIRGNHVLYYR